MTYPRPGSFGLVTVDGRIGRFIRLGQWFMGRAPKTPVHYAHAFLVLDGGAIIEAQTSGAVIDDVLDYAHPDFLEKGHTVLLVDVHMDAVTRERVIGAGRALEGTPYSFLDYVYLAFLRLGLPSEWLRKRVATSRHMICSQLVDEAYRAAGLHLFTDRRFPGNVTPSDLANWAISDPRVCSLTTVEGAWDPEADDDWTWD